MTWRDETPEREPIDVLLVEDNPGDVRLTREAFKDARIETTIHVVEDGLEALDFLYQRGEFVGAQRPSVVLLDFKLPRCNGDEVLAHVKRDPDIRPIPVIVLASSESHLDYLKSRDLRADAYLTKPIDPPEFVETLRELGEVRRSNARIVDGDG